MKSFLNRFRRNEEDEQPPAAPGNAAAEKEEAASPGEEPRRRTGISVTPPAPLAEGEQPARPSGVGKASKPEELVLELGDFLHRIPPQLLKPGTPDVHTELRFDLADIADRISRGETTIPIRELHAQVPHIFTNELLEAEDLEIRFPWQKVLKLINESAPGTVPTSSLTVAAEESLAHKLKTRHVMRNIATGRGAGGLNVPESPLGKAGSKLAQRPVTWFSRPTPVANPATPPPTAGTEGDAPTPPEGTPEASASPTSIPLGVQDSTALIEGIRAELQMELEAELRARDEELASIREEYERQIDALQAELAALKQAREESPEAAE